MKQVLRLFILLAIIVNPWLAKAQVTASFSGTPRIGCAPVIFNVTDASTTTSGTLHHKFYVYFDSVNVLSVTDTIPMLVDSSTSSPATFILGNSPLNRYGFYNIVDSVYSSTGVVRVDSQHDYVFVSNPTLYTRLTTSNPALDTNTCPGHTVTLVNKSDTVAGCTPSFTWYITTPSATTYTFTTTGRSQTLNYTFTAVGHYTIYIIETTCTGSCNGYPASTFNITVGSVPVACFTNTDSTPCHTPALVPFTNCSSGGAVSYLWKFGDGSTSTATNPTHSYTAMGTIKDTLIAYSSFGCADTVIDSGNIIVSNFIPTFSISATPICQFNAITSGTIAFTDETAGATTHAWTDNYAPPHTSAIANPTFTYATAGIYTVTETVSNVTGCSGSAVGTVTVNPAPAPISFTETNPYRCSPNDTVTLTATMPSTGVANYVWYFGNGHTALDSSNNINPATHIYTTAGTFKDSLIVRGTNGCASIVTNTTDPITIAAPTFSISIPVDSGCAPFIASYSTSISPVVTYTITGINFGDGSGVYVPPAGSTSGTHTYTVGGTHTVSVTYQLDPSVGGCVYTKTITVTVGTVQPNFNPAVSVDSVCPNTTFTVTCNCTNCTSFWWNFNGPGFPGGSNVYSCTATDDFTSQGQYYIRAIGNDAGCTDTVIDSIYVLAPAINMSYTVPDCSTPNVVSFSSLGSTGATGYHWSFGDGTTGTGASPSHTYTIGTGATYTVTLVDSAGTLHRCTNTAFIVINLYPTIDSFHANDTFACTGQSITFTGSKTQLGVDYPQYTWIWGDGSTPTTSTTSNISTHTYTATGIYAVSLVVKNNGCFDTTTKTNYITINGLSGGMTASPLVGCVPLTVDFTDNNTAFIGSVSSRHWNFNAQNPHAQAGAGVPDSIFVAGSSTATATYPEGNYSVILLDSTSNGCTVRDTVHISSQKPHAYFYSADSSIQACVGIAIPFHDTNTNCTYAWTFGDGSTGVGQNPTHIYTANGVYAVSVTITTTAGGTLPVGCTDTYTRTSYITIGNINVAFNLSNTFSACPPLVGFATNATMAPAGNVLSYQWRITPFGTIVSTSGIGYLYNLGSAGTTYDFTLIATNQLGCEDSTTETATITGPAGYLSFTPDSGCSPLSVTLCFVDTNSTSPTNFTWITGDGLDTNITSSCFSHTFVDTGVFHPTVYITGSGCVVQVPLDDNVAYTDSIRVFPVPTISISGDTFLCHGTSTTLTASGARAGGHYVWSPATGLSSTTAAIVTASPSVTTTYTVVGTTIHGCDNQTVVTITVDTAISVSISGKDSICANICDTLVASGGTGNNYTWSPGSAFTAINGLNGDSIKACATGLGITYTVVYTDAFNCTATFTKFVQVNPLPTAIAGTPSVCAGYTTQLSDGTPGGFWSSNDTLVATVDGSGLVYGVSPDSAVITYMTGLGCSKNETVTVDKSPAVILGTLNVCVDDTTIVSDTVTGGSWAVSPITTASITATSIGSATLTGVFAGPASVTYTLGDGCASTAILNVHPLPVITITPSDSALWYICKGTGVSLQLSANTTDIASYLWTPNIFISPSNTISNPSFSDSTDLVYHLKETTIYGCIDSMAIPITVYDSAITTISNDTSICALTSAYLIAYSSSDTVSADLTTYLWTPSTGLNFDNIYNPIATPATTTTYTVFIQENPCFSATRDVTVTVIPIPEIAVTAQTPITAGYPSQLSATITNSVVVSAWSWTPTSTLSCDSCFDPIAIPTINTTYTVTATTPIGCVGTADVTVVLGCKEAQQIFIPNTFTPNGDGNNDRFYLSGRGLGQIKRMSVYNRWGEEVYHAENINANDPGAGWDGTYRGQVLQPDVFVYVFDVLCEVDNTVFSLKGDISLVR